MNLGAVFCVSNLTCSFHMLHTWPTHFYVGPPTSTFLATLVYERGLLVRLSSDGLALGSGQIYDVVLFSWASVEFQLLMFQCSDRILNLSDSVSDILQFTSS